MATSWEYRYAQRTKGMKSSVVREILKVTSQPDVISFAGGMPAPELFPLKEVEEACVKVLREHGASALQYSISEGYVPLREFIVQKMGRYGIVANVDNVLITTGSQQGLDLVARVLLDPGDVIIVEAPTFVGALQTFTAYQAAYAGVPLDDDGMMVDILEELAREGLHFAERREDCRGPRRIPAQKPVEPAPRGTRPRAGLDGRARSRCRDDAAPTPRRSTAVDCAPAAAPGRWPQRPPWIGPGEKPLALDPVAAHVRITPARARRRVRGRGTR